MICLRKFAIAILSGILVVTCVCGYSDKIEEELSCGIVRMHIIADSDEKEAQEVKMKVRDEILEEMKKYKNADEVKENIGVFENVANDVLKENGCDYSARAEYGRFLFPTKKYENFALPKGEYNAVRIKIGRAEGQNWWCVMFPPLCLLDASCEESEEKLKETFGDNYDLVKNEKVTVKVKFKIAELF